MTHISEEERLFFHSGIDQCGSSPESVSDRDTFFLCARDIMASPGGTPRIRYWMLSRLLRQFSRHPDIDCMVQYVLEHTKHSDYDELFIPIAERLDGDGPLSKMDPSCATVHFCDVGPPHNGGQAWGEVFVQFLFLDPYGRRRPEWQRLKSILFNHNALSHDGLMAFARLKGDEIPPHLEQVLFVTDESDDIWLKAMAKNPAFRQIKSLSIRRNGRTSTSPVRVYGDEPPPPYTGITDLGCIPLLRSPHWQQLEYLDLHGTNIEESLVAALRLDYLPNLRRIQINTNPIRTTTSNPHSEGIEYIPRWGHSRVSFEEMQQMGWAEGATSNQALSWDKGEPLDVNHCGLSIEWLELWKALESRFSTE